MHVWLAEKTGMELALRLAAILVLAYAGVCLALFLLQGRMIFFPRPQQASPAGPDVAPVAVRRPDATLRGWVTNPEAPGPLVIYFGGNAEELSETVATFARLDAVTALVNYRGYGASDGAPTARHLIGDATAVVEAMRARLGDGRKTILIGRSLGSGIAALAAQATGVDGLVLVSPYVSIARIARRRFPFVPVGWLLRHDIDASEAVADLPGRTLVIHATADPVVPTTESRAFVALLTPPPQVVEFDGAHGVPLTTPPIWPAINAFVQSFADDPRAAPVG